MPGSTPESGKRFWRGESVFCCLFLPMSPRELWICLYDLASNDRPSKSGEVHKKALGWKGFGCACLPHCSLHPQPSRKSRLVMWMCPFQQHPCGSSDVCHSCLILGRGIYFAKLRSHRASEQPALGIKSKLWGLEHLKLKKKERRDFQVQRKKLHQAPGWRSWSKIQSSKNNILKISFGKIRYLWVKLSF